MRLFKRFFILFLGSAAVLTLSGCGSIYAAKHKISDIDSAISPDGRYEISFQTIGEPNRLFGDSQARLVLEDENGIVSKWNFDVANDGAALGPENWSVSWQDSCGQIIISGAKQTDKLYTLYFDGRVTEKESPEESAARDARTLWDAALISRENIIFPTETEENANGEVTFSASLRDFTESFNSVYRQIYAEDYLTAAENWIQLSALSPCFEYESAQNRFSADKRIASMPTISIFTPENGEGIYEIRLTFDDHGYQDALYEKFESICFCSLKTVLPEKSNADISGLYDELYTQTNETFWGDYYAGEDAERPVINRVYQYGSVGFYGYYGLGTANICIIPLSPEVSARLAQAGTEIAAVEGLPPRAGQASPTQMEVVRSAGGIDFSGKF